MKKQILIIGLIIFILSSIFLISCNEENNSSTKETTGLVSRPHPDDNGSMIIDRHVYGVKEFNFISEVNGIKTFDVLFANNILKTYYLETTNSTFRLYENSRGGREFILKNDSNGVTLKNDNALTNLDDTLFDDMFTTAYLTIGGDLNNVAVPQSDEGCIHSAISVRARKSITVENAQKLIDDFLSEHSECSQSGGIDSYCAFGDFGCISVGEIKCPSSSSSCQ